LPQGRPEGKQKMKAGVRKNDDFLQLWFVVFAAALNDLNVSYCTLLQ